MKNYKNNKKYNSMEQELLQQKLDKALEELENTKWAKNNTEFVNEIVMKERDRATLASKYLTHLFLLMDTLIGALENDYPLCEVIQNAIVLFKAKINEGMMGIHYDGENLWYEGINDSETEGNNGKKV